MLTVLTLLTACLSLTVQISPGETRCFRESMKNGDRFAINVHVSGGARLSFTLKAPNGGILEQNLATRSWSYSLSKTEPGYYELCATSPGNSKLAHMTFFWLSQTNDRADQPADTVGVLNQTVKVVRSLAANQRFTQSAEASHKLLIKSLSSSTSFWMFLKILVVLACIGYQIIEVKKHFAKRRTAV